MLQKKSILLIVFIALTFIVEAQDEIIKQGDSVAINYELKIRKITRDTLYFKAFRKSEFLFMKNVLAYRYKDSKWVWINPADKEKYVYRNGTLLLKYLQPDIILKSFEINISRYKSIRKGIDHKMIVTYEGGKKRKLIRERNLGFVLTTDTTSTFFVLPLHKISSDSLFFKATLNSTKKLYGIPATNFQYLTFETNLEIAAQLFVGVLFGVAAMSVMTASVSNSFLLQIPNSHYSNSHFLDLNLQKSDWIIMPSTQVE